MPERKSRKGKSGRPSRRQAGSGHKGNASNPSGANDNSLYELTPATICVPLRPILNESADSARHLRGLQMIGATTGSITVDEAMRGGEELDSHHRRRFKGGNKEAVLDLLRISPAFMRCLWVREALDELERSGWFKQKRRRGRPRGVSDTSRAVRTALVALVDYRVAKSNLSREKVFTELAGRGFENLSWESIRIYYYSTRRDTRLGPILAASEDEKRIVSRREIEEELSG